NAAGAIALSRNKTYYRHTEKMGLPQIIAEKRRFAELMILSLFFPESAFICVHLRLILLSCLRANLRLRVRNRAQFALAGHAEFDGALLRQRVEGQLVAP